MQFIVEYSLAPDPASAIEQHRTAHLAYRMGLKSLRLAAQILSDDAEMVGSILLIDAADQDEAERIALADPYCEHGIYVSTIVRPCEVRFCDLVAGPPA